jgi:methyl-accepting chemotaxis protein
MASTSEELSSQGQQLQQTMSFFRVDEPGGSGKRVEVKREPVAALEGGKPGKAKAASGKGVDLDMSPDADDKDFERF